MTKRFCDICDRQMEPTLHSDIGDVIRGTMNLCSSKPGGPNGTQRKERFTIPFTVSFERKDGTMPPDVCEYCLSNGLREAMLSGPKAEAPCGTEEGEKCNRAYCDGIIKLHKPANCSCHISPPCSVCVNSLLACTKCGFEIARENG